jgi:hypothetical protein
MQRMERPVVRVEEIISEIELLRRKQYAAAPKGVVAQYKPTPPRSDKLELLLLFLEPGVGKNKPVFPVPIRQPEL